jgi:putative ABC transport system permease protein
MLIGSSIAGDIRYAFRQIARTPFFSSVVIAVMALGIGINAGLLTALDSYAWKPAPGIPSDSRLVRLTPQAMSARSNQLVDTYLSYADIRDLREQRNAFADVAGWGAQWLPTDFGGGAESARVWYTTANYFRLLRVALAAGTGFPEDVDRSPAPLAVISHAHWIANFGGSADLIGKTIRVLNTPVTIVGVAPPLFAGVNVTSFGQPSIWIPLSARALIEPGAQHDPLRRDEVSLQGFARLAPGVDAGDLPRLTAGVAARIAGEDPAAHRGFIVRAERMTGMRSGRGETVEAIVAFLLVAALIVLITCTNVSALLLGRAVARRREIAVRLALGASRLRIVRQMLTESLVLAFAGALTGILLYIVTMKVAYAMIPEVIWGLDPKPVTFFYAAAFALATTVAVGLAPALHASRVGVGEAIKDSGTHAIRRTRLQAAFVVAQLACSQPVLVVTSLVLADLRASATSAADQAPAAVVTMDSELRLPSGELTPAMRASAARANRATYELIRRRLEEIPGVQSAAVSTSTGSSWFEAPNTGTAAVQVQQVHVSPGYFATLSIPLVRGRAIAAQDNYAGFTGVVINEETAKRLWPGQDPVGKRLVRHDRASEPEGFLLNSAAGSPAALEVIGVAGSLSYQGNRTTPMLFSPMANAASLWNASLIVRKSGGGNARAIVPAIRAAMREVDPLATVGDVATLAERYAARAREEMLSNAAAFAVAAAALLLASLGLYAIIAFAVAQRTREIGIRLAVGATPGEVVRQFLRNGLKVTALGLAIGIPATVAGIRIVQANLVGFTPRNVASILIVVPILIGIAAVASWLPARRAGRVDPLAALRSE